MGVFDELQLWDEAELPDGYAGRDFQTKDTPAQYLSHYRITKDGALEVFEFDTEPDTDQPMRENWLTKKMEHPTRRINERWTEVTPPFHGDIYFYTYEGDYNAEPDSVVWRNYIARFSEGRFIRFILCDENGRIVGENL